MPKLSTDTAAVVRLGGHIVGMARDLDGALAATSGSEVREPVATAVVLSRLAEAYRRSATRLRADVVALGRLTQAVGAEYDAVEAASARLYRSAMPGTGPRRRWRRGPRHGERFGA